MLALIRPMWLLAAIALAGQSERPLEAGMVIERSVTIRPGTNRLSSSVDPTRQTLTSSKSGLDDGVRGWMDDAMNLDEWLPHASKVSRVPIAGAAYRFKVVYYNVTGFAGLRFDIQRK